MDTTTAPFSPEQTANALGELKRDQLRTMATGLKVDNARTMGKPALIDAIGAKLREIADVPAPKREIRVRGKRVEFRGTGKRSPRGVVLTPAGVGMRPFIGQRQPGRKFGPATHLSRQLALAG